MAAARTPDCDSGRGDAGVIDGVTGLARRTSDVHSLGSRTRTLSGWCRCCRRLASGLLDASIAGGYSEDTVAQTGFFTRLANLWRGFLSLWISDLEKDHPEVAYENSINAMIEKYQTLKKATAAIIRRREDIEGRADVKRKDLEQAEADLETALDSEQDDLALVLITKKDALASEVGELNAELEQARQDAEDAKASLMNVQSEINKLKQEKDRMLAKMASAKARLQIQEQLDGLSVDAEVKALDNVREHINSLAAESDLNKELADETVENRLQKLRRQTGDVTARKQLEALKAKRAAAKAGTQKTM